MIANRIYRQKTIKEDNHALAFQFQFSQAVR